MCDATEVWYQASVQLVSNGPIRGQIETRTFPIGPPRRLPEDVILDLVRSDRKINTGACLVHREDQVSHWTIAGRGVTQLWPDVTYIPENDFNARFAKASA